jgi:hypothetical protein
MIAVLGVQGSCTVAITTCLPCHQGHARIALDQGIHLASNTTIRAKLKNYSTMYADLCLSLSNLHAQLLITFICTIPYTYAHALTVCDYTFEIEVAAKSELEDQRRWSTQHYMSRSRARPAKKSKTHTHTQQATSLHKPWPVRGLYRCST